MVALTLLIGAALWIIVDLDHPRGGLSNTDITKKRERAPLGATLDSLRFVSAAVWWLNWKSNVILDKTAEKTLLDVTASPENGLSSVYRL